MRAVRAHRFEYVQRVPFVSNYSTTAFRVTAATWADWCKKAERSAQTGEEVCRHRRHNVRALSVSGPQYKADCRQQATSLQSRCIALAASCLRCFEACIWGVNPGRMNALYAHSLVIARGTSDPKGLLLLAASNTTAPPPIRIALCS